MPKTAVIGAGYLGQYHAEKYSKLAAAELMAVVDVVEDRAREVAGRVGAQGLADYRLLPELGVQCASVVSDTSTHYAISKWLLEHDIDVLVEKPFTTTEAEALELIELAKRRKRILQVGHLERFNPAVRAMKEVLDRPMFFEVRRIAPFKNRGHDVDVVMDLMIHDIDIVQHLVGRPVQKVEAIGVPVLTKTIDIANARITFEGGAIANVSASRAAFKTERTLRIFQPNVYISLDYANKSLKIYSRVEGQAESAFPQITTREFPIEERDALEHEISSFVESVETRKTPEVTGEDGLRAIQLAGMIQEAFRECRKTFEWALGPIEQTEKDTQSKTETTVASV